MIFSAFLNIVIVSGLVVNEVYPNPPGSESGAGSPGDRFEFVEIYNNSPSPVDIMGYKISDGDEVDSLVPVMDSTFLLLFPGVVIENTVIPPYSFALILDSEFLMDSSGPFPYEVDSGAVLLTTTDTDIGNGLSNSDPIFLIDPNGTTVSTYGTPDNPLDSLPLNPPDGVSVERVSPDEPDEFENWRFSRWNDSPGKVNSWSLDLDLGFVQDSTRIYPGKPSEQDSVTITGFIYNYGRSNVSQLNIVITVGTYTTSKTFELTLSPDSGILVSTVLPPFPEGSYRVNAVISISDLDPTDDTTKTGFYSGKPPLVINEIMYDAPVEWVELYNRSQNSVSLQGFEVVDSAGNNSGSIEEYILPPQSYIVIADNQDFQNQFSGVTFLIPPNGLPSLNNSEDVIMIFDSLGILVDHVYYRSSYGGGNNVSLERVSPELPSDLPGNWTTCRDPSGGTPGRKNSVYTEVTPAKGEVMLMNRILSSSERAVLSYDFGENTVKMDVTLFDLRGRLISRPVDSESLPGTGQVVFDTPQQPGLYILFVDVQTSRGRIKKKLTFSIKP